MAAAMKNEWVSEWSVRSWLFHSFNKYWQEAQIQKKKFFIDMKSETYSTFSQYCGYAFKNDQSYGGGWGIKSACLTS